MNHRRRRLDMSIVYLRTWFMIESSSPSLHNQSTLHTASRYCVCCCRRCTYASFFSSSSSCFGRGGQRAARPAAPERRALSKLRIPNLPPPDAIRALDPSCDSDESQSELRSLSLRQVCSCHTITQNRKTSREINTFVDYVFESNHGKEVKGSGGGRW